MSSLSRRNGESRPCPICGEIFYRPAYYLAAHPLCYCSPACMGMAKAKDKAARICETCGQRFQVRPSALSKPGGGRFCSHRCCAAAVAARRQPQAKVCKTCGKEFRPAKGEVLRGSNGYYCSEGCRRWVGGPPCKPTTTVRCLGCDQKFVLPGRHSHRATFRRFCSTQCWYEYLRLHPETGGRFLGGAEPYYGPNWYEQARKARKRDRFTCQDCGRVRLRPTLHVHHILPRRQFGGDYLTANQLDNLVTLCEACHARRTNAEIRAGILLSIGNH